MKVTTAAEKRLAGCEGKERFPTFTLARRIAHRQAQNKKRRFVVYHCQFCGGCHVGTRIGLTDSSKGSPDSRQRYAVFAALGRGRSTLVGFTNAADGGRLAQMITGEGWRITNVVDRQARVA